MFNILIKVVIFLFSINLIICADEINNKNKENEKQIENVNPVDDTHTEQSIFPVDKETEHLNITSKYPIPTWMKESDSVQTGFFIFSVLGIVAIVWIAVKAFK